MTEVSDFSAGGFSEDGEPAGARRSNSSGGYGGGPDGAEPARSGLSFAGKGCHDSVRVVIPERGASSRACFCVQQPVRVIGAGAAWVGGDLAV